MKHASVNEVLTQLETFLLHSTTILSLLFSVASDDVASVCSCVTRIFWAYKKDVFLLQEAVKHECESTSSLECAFREDGVTVTLIKEFFIIHESYMTKKTISKAVRSVQAKSDLDLDLRRDNVEYFLIQKHPQQSITDDMINETIKQRSEMLMKFVNAIIKKFGEVASRIPQELRDFVKILKFNLQDNPKYFYQMVGGWFFLRSIVPALVTPEKTSFWKKSNGKITSQNRRNLVMIGKVLQGIANEAAFGEKETHLEVLQTQVHDSMMTFRNIIDNMAIGPISPVREIKCDAKRAEKVRPYTNKLLSYFTSHVDDLKTATQRNANLSTPFVDENEVLDDLKELESILAGKDLGKNNTDLASKWEIISKRRRFHEKSMSYMDMLNSSERRSSLSQFSLSDLSSSQDIAPLSSSRSLNSSRSTNSGETDSDSLLTISTRDETSECTDPTDNEPIENEPATPELTPRNSNQGGQKLMAKIKYRSKVANISFTTEVTHKQIMQQISRKLSLKASFSIYYRDNSKEVFIRNEGEWAEFLRSQSSTSNGICLYYLFIRTVK